MTDLNKPILFFIFYIDQQSFYQPLIAIVFN